MSFGDERPKKVVYSHKNFESNFFRGLVEDLIFKRNDSETEKLKAGVFRKFG